MLDLQYVRKHPERVEKALADRFMDLSLEPLQELDKKRREMLVEVEQLKHKRKESLKPQQLHREKTLLRQERLLLRLKMRHLSQLENYLHLF